MHFYGARGCLLSLTLLAACVARAQQIPFVRMTGENAPNGSSAIYEDKRGGLWLASMEFAGGLTFFDGQRFIPIPLSKSRVLQAGEFAQDEDGGLWIGAGQGLFRLFGGKLETKIDGRFFAAIEVAPNVLLAIRIPPYDKARWELVRAAKRDGAWKVEIIGSAPYWIGLARQRDGRALWITSAGFAELNGNEAARWTAGRLPSFTIQRYYLPPGTAVPTRMIKDRFGCIWSRNRQNTWYQCPADKVAHLLPSDLLGRGGNGIYELSDGTIVIPSFASLVLGRPGRFRSITVANGYPSVGGVAIGRDDTLWISNANGLFAYTPRLNLEYWTERDGLGGNTWSILPQRGRTLAIAGEEVRVLDDDRSRWRRLASLPLGLRLVAGPGETFFAGSEKQGVVQMDRNGRVLARWSPQSSPMAASGLPEVAWMRPDISFNSPSRVGPDAKKDSKGHLWVCTTKGFAVQEGAGWRQIDVNDSSLAGNACSGFAIGAQNEIWYGNLFSGYSLLQMAKGATTLTHFREGNDVGLGPTHFLGVDSRGWIWRGTADGVYIAEEQEARERKWLRLNRNDGLPGVDTNRRSFASAADGSVWFGIDSSVIHITPARDFTRPDYAPYVFVSGLSWGGGAFRLASQVSDLTNGKAVTAYLGSLQFDRRNDIQMRYRLLPDRAKWMPVQNWSIDLGSPASGAHEIQLQARLAYGPWSNITRKGFTVLTPFWLSWPFLLGFALVGGTAGITGYHWRAEQRARLRKAFPRLTRIREAMFAEQSRDWEGTVLDGRFQIEAELGQGGFGAVFTGREVGKGSRACAIKIFRRDIAGSPVMESFRKEVLTLERMQQGNIVRIYGHGVAQDGSPYLAMEFIEGSTLRTLLSAKPLSRQVIADYLRQASDALAALHAEGIIHRDIKPENLMIRSSAQFGLNLVLIDFSIALVKDPDKTLNALTRLAGTLDYMAPEQSSGYAEASSDIYALAKVTIEMLVGERVAVLLPGIVLDLPERIRELLEEQALPSRAIQLLSSALEFHPRDRPSDVRLFAEEICRNLGAFRS